MELFTERHAAKIIGTIPGICYADGISNCLRIKGICNFKYPSWAEPLRDQIRQNAQALAEQARLCIEH